MGGPESLAVFCAGSIESSGPQPSIPRCSLVPKLPEDFAASCASPNYNKTLQNSLYMLLASQWHTSGSKNELTLCREGQKTSGERKEEKRPDYMWGRKWGLEP